MGTTCPAQLIPVDLITQITFGGKIKVVPGLSLTEHHAIKAYWGGGIAPRDSTR